MSDDKQILNFLRGKKEDEKSRSDKSSSGSDPVWDTVWDWSGRYEGKINPDTDAAWNRFKASTRPVRKLRPSYVKWINAAAIALAMGILAWIWINKAPSLESVRTLATERKEIRLDDGTKVILNHNSSLQFAKNLAGSTERKVILKGEAYFDVAHDEDKQFVIAAGDATITVLGTAFNVRAYPTEAGVEVEVERGTVQLSDEAHQVILHAGEKGEWRPGMEMQAEKSPGLNAQSWRTGRLVFASLPVSKAVKALERNYEVKIDISNSGIQDCVLTSNFDKESLNRVFTILSKYYGVKVVAKGAGNYELTGGQCH